MAKRVSMIRFEMVVDGRRVVATFMSDDKIRDLLEEKGSLGQALRDLRDSKR